MGGEWARFIFISGRLCIDFTQTGGETEIRAAWERLHRPADLTDWFAESPLQLEKIKVSPQEFEAALSLRESIWRVAQAFRLGAKPRARDINTINRAARSPALTPQLGPDGRQQTWLAPHTAEAALATIALDAIDLFSSDLRDRIRECENPKCSLIFVDTSRPGKRRWCLMERCGNMAKTARYRRRLRDEEALDV